jgi:hypothetical protein
LRYKIRVLVLQAQRRHLSRQITRMKKHCDYCKVFSNPLSVDYLFVDMSVCEDAGTHAIDRNMMLCKIGQQSAGVYQVILNLSESRRKFAQLKIISKKYYILLLF